MVTNAVSEMRRYYSRKVIDVLIKVTRSSLDVLRRVFAQDSGEKFFFLAKGAVHIWHIIFRNFSHPSPPHHIKISKFPYKKPSLTHSRELPL